MHDFSEKYGLASLGVQRTYLVDLKKRVYGYERANVVNATIESFAISDVSWKELTLQVAKYLQKNHQKKLEDLYAFEVSWSKAPIFRKEKFQISCEQMDDDLWVNVAFASTHGIMLFQDLLEFYGVDLNACSLSVHLPSMSEPIEVVEYYKKKIIKAFMDYLLDENIPEKTCHSIIRSIEVLNKALINLNCGSNDFFLIDNRLVLSNCKSKVLKYLSDNNFYNLKQRQMAERYLKYYSKFFAEYEIRMLAGKE